MCILYIYIYIYIYIFIYLYIYIFIYLYIYIFIYLYIYIFIYLYIYIFIYILYSKYIYVYMSMWFHFQEIHGITRTLAEELYENGEHFEVFINIYSVKKMIYIWKHVMWMYFREYTYTYCANGLILINFAVW